MSHFTSRTTLPSTSLDPTMLLAQALNIHDEKLKLPNGGLIDLKVNINLPAEVANLAAKLSHGFDSALETVWWDGFWRGTVTASIAFLVLYIVVQAWNSSKKADG